MWKIIQELLPFVLVILVLTQYVIPILIGSKTWWLFRPSDKVKETIKGDLNTEIAETKKVVDEVKVKVNQIKEKADEHFKSAEQLKKESEKLL